MADFRSCILNQLRRRNDEISNSYGPLMKAYEELLETVVILKMKRENSSTSEAQNNGNLSNLEKKLAEMQEELTDLYKRRSENAQNLLDANKKIEFKDVEITNLKRKLQEYEEKDARLSATNATLQEEMSGLQQTNTHLKDEHVALQTSLTILEQKFKNLQEENQKICSRYLELKLREADVMNMENTWQQKLRELNLQTKLAEATKEQIVAPQQVTSSDDITVLKHNRRSSLSKHVIATLPSRCQFKIEAHDGEVNTVRWSPNGKFLATGGADRRIKLWNIEEEKPRCVSKLDGCNSTVTCLDFDDDEALCACASNDFGVRVWTLSTQRLSVVFSGHSNKVQVVKFFRGGISGGRLASGSHDRTLKIWDMRARCCSKTLFAGSICNDLVTSGDGAIISGHYDKKLRFWDTRSEKAVNEVAFSNKITSLSLSTDASYLLCCTRDDQLINFDLRMNQSLKIYSGENFKIGADYTRCCFSPDQQFCSAGSSHGELFVWNVDSGDVECILGKQHESTIVDVCWHPNGQQVASCDKHKTLCIWCG